MVLPAAVICSTFLFQPCIADGELSSELADLFCKTLDQSSALRCFDSNRFARICYLGSILQKSVLPSLSLRSADNLIYTFITQFMSGPSFGPLADRFTSNLIDRLEGEDISNEWKEYLEPHAPRLRCWVTIASEGEGHPKTRTLGIGIQRRI